MTDKLVQRGQRITLANSTGSTIAKNTVVRIGNILAIALVSIVDGASGECGIGEVYNVPKVSGAVIAQGEYVTWDASAGAFDDSLASPATGDVSKGAVAWEAAGNGVTEVAVLLLPSGGTVA